MRRVNLSNSNSNIIVIVIFKTEIIVIVIVIYFFFLNNSNSNIIVFQELLCTCDLIKKVLYFNRNYKYVLSLWHRRDPAQRRQTQPAEDRSGRPPGPLLHLDRGRLQTPRPHLRHLQDQVERQEGLQPPAAQDGQQRLGASHARRRSAARAQAQESGAQEARAQEERAQVPAHHAQAQPVRGRAATRRPQQGPRRDQEDWRQ